MLLTMKITVLGSGAWEGIPAPFCDCDVCAEATKNPSSKNNRTRPQLLVENNNKQFLIEISPDIRLQSAKFALKPIKDFLISHAHFDHMDGIKELHQYSIEAVDGLNIYCSQTTKNALITDEYSYIPQHITALEPLQSFELAGIAITPLPVYHMNAQDSAIPEEQLVNTFGYLLEYEGKRVAYMADYYRVPQAVIAKVQNVDAIICDGTYLLTDDFKERKINHLHGQDIVSFANRTNAKRAYYHSVSHLTHKNHGEMQAILPTGHYLTYDGLELDF